MQKQLKLMLLFTVASFILFTGFKRDNPVSSSKASNTKASPVTITAVFNFSTFPDVFGTFTTGGSLNLTGTAEMIIGPNNNGIRAHCVVILTTPNGTFTIHQECVFATNPPKGRWEIVSGTGAYANLKGNGSLLMPPDTEAMEGFIY